MGDNSAHKPSKLTSQTGAMEDLGSIPLFPTFNFKSAK